MTRLFIIITALNIVSMLWYFYVQKNVGRLLKTHVRVLGSENRHFERTPKLYLLRGVYTLSIVLSVALSYYLTFTLFR